MKRSENEPGFKNPFGNSVNLYSMQHQSIQCVFIGFPEQLLSLWMDHYSQNERWQILSAPKMDEINGLVRLLLFVDMVLLYVPYKGFSEFSGLMISVKKKFPNAHIVILSEGCDPVSVQQSFFLGASGYLLTKDTISKSAGRLQLLCNKHIPAVSEKLIPSMVEALKGPGIQVSPIQPLSEIQYAIAKLLVKGLSYDEIGETLQKNLDTVRYHVKKIYQKYNISRRMQLVPLFQE